MTDAHKVTNLTVLVVMQFALIAGVMYALIRGQTERNEEQDAFNKVRKELNYKNDALKACTEHVLKNGRTQ